MIAWKIKKVIKKTKKYFEATYKKHRFLIVWKEEWNRWNILVVSDYENGDIVYNGFWGNKNYDIDDAIYEAMRGSGLI